MGVDPQLQKIVSYLVSAEDKVAKGTFGAGQRPWVNFSDVKKAGKFDYAALHELFDRSASNDAYAKGTTDATTPGKDMQTAKLSADFLAGFERDYRMRTRSRIRMMVHGGNRAAANGLGNGPLRRNTDWLARVLTASKG
jgi:hypothetical protein